MTDLNVQVKVFPFANPMGKAKAFASVTLNNVIEIKGFKVIEGSKGLFVSAPQTKGKNKETGEDTWYPDVIFHEQKDPENGVYKGPVEDYICKAIISAYQQNSGSQQRGAAASAHAHNQTQSAQPANSSPFGSGPAW